MRPFTRHIAPLILALLLFTAVAPLTVSATPEPPIFHVEATYAPESLFIQFSPDASPVAKAQAYRALGVEPVQTYSLVPGLELVRLQPGAPDEDLRQGKVPEAIAAASELPYVLYAEPNYLVQPVDTVPNDPYYSSLYGMARINAPAAWDISTGVADLIVAVIDTGTDYTHTDLNDNIWINSAEQNGVAGVDDDANGYIDDVRGWDFFDRDNNPTDANGHGTHTAGTVCAEGNNATGVVGVVWRCKIMPLRFLGPGGGYTSDAIAALSYAVAKGAKVSNNSWGGGGYSTALYTAISNARASGHIFVAAAGNSGANNDTTPFYPASYNLDNLISVAATDSSDGKASFSSYGLTSVDLGAPGVSIRSTVPNNTYAYYSGTSMAAPHVAGVVALVYGLHPEWSYGQVRDRILSTVRSVASLAGKTATGGVVNAAAAVGAAFPTATPTNTPAPPTATPTNTPVPPTATPTNTPAAPTATPTNTSIPPSATPTNTPAPPTATPTNTPVPPTATPTNTPAPPTATPTNTPVPPTPTNTPAPGITVHVGDLDRTATLGVTGRWSARVTIYVHNNAEAPRSGAVVSGVWSDGATGTATCTANTTGSCNVSVNGLLLSSVASVRFTVNGLGLAGYSYAPASNHDPDGDSDGSSIVVSRP